MAHPDAAPDLGARRAPAAPPRPQAAALHIEARGVAADYAIGRTRRRVMQAIDMAVPRGGFVSIIGPSGCGKSTLLKVLAGLVPPSAGEVRVAGLAPAEAVRRRLIGLVFQEATLLPWKSALDNAALLLETADKTLPRGAARERARQMLRLVRLEDAMDLRPSQLSGGMRQRVAIARALALDPEVLMMDEPFGALDAITREEMSRCLLEVWERTGKTVVLVTHSIDEAVFLSQGVHVMASNPGRIIETLPIPLPYPRTEHSYENPAFGHAAARLRALLFEGHGAARGR